MYSSPPRECGARSAQCGPIFRQRPPAAIAAISINASPIVRGFRTPRTRVPARAHLFRFIRFQYARARPCHYHRNKLQFYSNASLRTIRFVSFCCRSHSAHPAFWRRRVLDKNAEPPLTGGATRTAPARNAAAVCYRFLLYFDLFVVLFCFRVERALCSVGRSVGRVTSYRRGVSSRQVLRKYTTRPGRRGSGLPIAHKRVVRSDLYTIYPCIVIEIMH